MSDVRMVVTDLDGTLLQKNHTISMADTETLLRLGEAGVYRVAATGRSLFKVKQVLNKDVLFEYVIFLSGAGIVDWKTGKIIRNVSIPSETARELTSFLVAEKQNFKVAKHIPGDHNFAWWGSYRCAEFDKYVEHYKGIAKVEKLIPGCEVQASQFMVVIPNNTEKFNALKEKITACFHNVSVIRATSPVNSCYIWLEIFPQDVSKAKGIGEICGLTKVDRACTLSIGNDFNDLEMLEYTQYSYVVGNAPVELKSKYKASSTYSNNGFTHAVRRHFD